MVPKILRIFCLLPKCLPSIVTKKLHVKIGVFKLQSLTLLVTRRVVLLVHCIARKHSGPKPDVTFKCKLCHAEFPGFYALRQHKNTQHGTQIGLGASNIDVEDIVGDVDDHSLREELESGKHFLTYTEMENGRQRVFNFALSSFDMSLLNDKLDYVFKELKCAAKVNVAFGFVLKFIEDGMCRYFYAHQNNTKRERAKLVCTQSDMTSLKDRMQKMDIVDLCTRERANSKVEILQNYKFNNFCFVTQRCTHGL